MKITTALLFIACLPCFGQTDTNLIAAGGWSEAVKDSDGYTLRGRLLVYDEHTPPYHARVYLELQHVFNDSGWWDSPFEIYFKVSSSDVLHFEMRDGHDQPIPMFPVVIRGPVESPYWVTLPCDSTVRVRADWCNMGPSSKPDGLEIFMQDGGCWLMPPDATNDFYLSASFTPPTNHPSSLNYHVWHGTLVLPKVKIPVKNP